MLLPSCELMDITLGVLSQQSTTVPNLSWTWPAHWENFMYQEIATHLNQ
jgi:hypothetical protein